MDWNPKPLNPDDVTLHRRGKGAPLVLIHEAGHYLVARACGVGVRVFSIGFGREIFGWTDRRGTRWKVSVLPLGGYVQFVGDMNAASQAADADEMSAAERAVCFQYKPLWQRFSVVLAGPAANFMVAVLVFAAFTFAFGKILAPPIISGFADNSPAKAAGLEVGDRIVAIDGHGVDSFEDIREAVLPRPGEAISLTALRDPREVVVRFTIGAQVMHDEYGNAQSIGLMGVASAPPRRVAVGPLTALGSGLRQSVSVMGTMVTGLRQIATGARSVKELGGPVKIARYSGERLNLGFLEFAYFSGLISINLAFINLLPIPGLDGGHLAFYLAEAVRRRPLGLRAQDMAFRTGLAFVLALMLFVTVNDLASLNLFGHLFGR